MSGVECTEYISSLWKDAFRTYTEYIGLEIQTLIIAANKDQVALAAWVTLQSLMTLTYTCGQGTSHFHKTKTPL
jgi:alpha/beta superfamily hydrolase